MEAPLFKLKFTAVSFSGSVLQWQTAMLKFISPKQNHKIHTFHLPLQHCVYTMFFIIDDDLDGLIDEDCAGWAQTSYLDVCTTDADCNIYGQLFECIHNQCLCSISPPPLKDSRGWFYDNIDGLCWRKSYRYTLLNKLVAS